MRRRELTRRTFLGAAAAGATALALGDAGVVGAATLHSPVTLEFWNPATDPQNGANMVNLVNTFNRTVGKAEGIVVHNRPVPSDNSYVKYTTAMSSSGSPDVVMTYDPTMIAGWGANGFIQPMDAFAQVLRLRASDYFPIVWDTVHINGHIWGLLQEFDMNLLSWNKAIHKGAPPRTIAALDALAQHYTKFDKKGNLVQAGLVPWDSGAYPIWAAALGARFYDDAKGKWTINTPQNRKLLEWFLKYAHILGSRTKAASFVAAGGSVASDRGVFYVGTTAFGTLGEYDGIHLRVLAPHLKYGVAPVPTAPGVPAGTNFMPGGNIFLLPTKAPHAKEAATFIRWMDSLQGVMHWCISAGNIPPLRSAVPQFVKAAESPHLVPLVRSPQFSVFDTEMANAIDAVTYLKKTPAQALADVDQKVASAVQQFKSFHPTWPSE